MQLALYTFGTFARPSEDPANDGFHALNDPVMAEVDRAEGLIARSGYASDPGPAPWGPEVYPRFYTEAGDGWSPATLSLWRDLESLAAFAYSGLHAEALKRRREWFDSPGWASLVMWWHIPGAPLHWADGATRLERITDHGPSAAAFDFKTPFDAEGRHTTIDRSRVRALNPSARSA